jgi:hypothetical protein
MKACSTTCDVIDACGGTGAFAKWWGVKATTVCNWRSRGFPPALYVKMKARLRREKRIAAPPSCWGMVDVERSRSA